VAPQLYRTLLQISDEINEGRTDYAKLESDAVTSLTTAGFRPEYIGIRCATDLGEARNGADLVVLAAAWLGRARLIDNVLVGR
jgi:pantoate--beta-alanine ligase